MTDFSNDELASAYLDGEVTADERARIEGDPALMTLVAQLRSVRDAVVDTPIEAPTAAVRDRAIQAAVRSSTIIDLRAERSRRRLRTASIAAAVIAVVGGLGFLVSSIGSSSDRKLSASSSNSSAAAPTGNRATATAEGFAAADTATLGTFDARNPLIDAARTAVASARDEKQAAPSAAGAGAQADTPTTLDACTVSPPDATGQVLRAAAVLEGKAVNVDVFATPDGQVLVVTDAATCAEVFSQPL